MAACTNNCSTINELGSRRAPRCVCPAASIGKARSGLLAIDDAGGVFEQLQPFLSALPSLRRHQLPRAAVDDCDRTQHRTSGVPQAQRHPYRAAIT
jgi:hypothetical protein